MVKATQFQKQVWTWYQKHGRHDLPWRKTINPYHILVSEVMLQQTQVERVVPKYQTFLRQFPNTKRLAEAPLRDVLIAWQGLGYNRRAKALHECAKLVTSDYRGRWPQTYEGLQALPGIGPYTAGAVLAFAYNQAVPIIETNIRTVYLHHFFSQQTKVGEDELLKAVTATLDHKRPREWYWALMDYGSYLKSEYGNPNKRAKNYTRQSTFKGSDREIRGAIIRTLTVRDYTQDALCQKLAHLEPRRVATQVKKLLSEELIIQKSKIVSLPE